MLLPSAQQGLQTIFKFSSERAHRKRAFTFHEIQHVTSWCPSGGLDDIEKTHVEEWQQRQVTVVKWQAQQLKGTSSPANIVSI